MAPVAAGLSFLVYDNSQQAAAINRLSMGMQEKSIQLEQQQQKIDEYHSLQVLWQEELDDKRSQLETLQGDIDALAQKISSQETLISEKSEQASRLEAEFATMKMHAANLEKEITELQSVINAKDESLAGLVLENESARRLHVVHYMLGVYSNKDTGVVFPIEVEIIGSGAGRISVDVSNVQYEASFQDSVRTAAAVASAYTGIAVSNKDIIVTMVNDSDRMIKIDGPSAGAVIAAMIVAGLEEKELDPSVLVTGTVKQDGTIGRVGGILAKADAAAAHGADMLLVPKGQEFSHDAIEVEAVGNMEQMMNRLIRK